MAWSLFALLPPPNDDGRENSWDCEEAETTDVEHSIELRLVMVASFEFEFVEPPIDPREADAKDAMVGLISLSLILTGGGV